jgi:AraC-like DNA-binding protein
MGVWQQDIYTKAETESELRRGTPEIIASKNGGGKIPPEVRAKLNREVVRLMERECVYRNPELRLEHVVRALNTNRNYLTTVIREDFGDTFIGFVNGYRIGEAKELLAEHGRAFTMTEIAGRVGFKSISSFNTFFKRETGTNPTDFRKGNGNSSVGNDPNLDT